MEQIRTYSGLLAFIFLAASICAAWIQREAEPSRKIHPWMMIFVASLLCGLVAGVVSPVALVESLAFATMCYFASDRNATKVVHPWRTIAVALFALVLAMHKLPGFHNPLILDAVSLSASSAPFTLYANFDKGVVGLFLLAYMCQRSSSLHDVVQTIGRTIPTALATISLVLLVGYFAGYIRPDIKFLQVTFLFLAINLFFTVVAEEAFFRGFLQQRLFVVLKRYRYGSLVTVLVSAMLFGLAHAAGGAITVGLATLAGLGYAYAYYRTQRIEAPIFIHFSLNAIHFIFFTYPSIA